MIELPKTPQQKYLIFKMKNTASFEDIFSGIDTANSINYKTSAYSFDEAKKYIQENNKNGNKFIALLGIE